MGEDYVRVKHLNLFEKHYNPSLFDNKKTLKKDIERFLTFLQDELGKIMEMSGE